MPIKKTKLTDKQREKYLRKIFPQLIYDNMAMENEMPFSKKEIARRYKLQTESLIRAGVHKKIVVPKSFYVKNKAGISKN